MTMILIIIIVMLLTIIGWICLVHDEDTIAIICFFLVIVIWIGAETYNGSKEIEDTPTALDVYRGKTTLEITYRDSVAVDSVVVYKMK